MEAFAPSTFIERPTGTAPAGQAPAAASLRRVSAAETTGELRSSSVAPWATPLTFVLADVLAFMLVEQGISGLDRLLYPGYAFVPPTSFLLAAALAMAAFALKGLYSAVSMHPAQELRRVSVVTIVVGLSLVAGSVLAEAPARATALVAATGALALVMVPLCRVFARTLFSRASWWGMPVVVVGSGAAGRSVIDAMRRWPELGFEPVALLQEDYTDGTGGANGTNGRPCAVPVIHDISLLPALATDHGVRYAVLALPDRSPRHLAGMLEGYGRFFKRIFVVPGGIAEAIVPWTTSRSCEGLLGHGVQHYARHTVTRVVKRSMDLVGGLLCLLLAAPLLLTIAVLVRLSSPGPVFFRQKRLGREGRIFEVLKFRTMYEDAEVKLQDILRTDEERREEYRRYHKLRDDPRVTPIGTWLRRYSLDELPQLWNVLKGQMSLVGPRAYLPAELSQMNGLSRTVLQGPPGVTGLWQVSGRNDLSFEERVDLDVHYVHNWNPWLDVYILARTLPVVFTGEGAS